MGADVGPRAINSSGIALTLGFIVVVQAVALYFTYVNAPVTAQAGGSFAPAGTSDFGSLSNAVILVLAVFATTLAAIWLIRNRRVRISPP